MNNSGLSSGRFGFRGVEDLGGGLKAGFWLESDVNADTGTFSSTGKFFQRRSTISLMGNFGEVRLRSEEHTSELQSHSDLVCRLLLEKKKIRSVKIHQSKYTRGAKDRSSSP